MKKLLIIIILFHLYGYKMYAGHPLNTDDAFNVGKGNWEFEIISEYIIDNNYRELGFPLAATYGFFPDIDLIVSTPIYRSWGGGNTALGFGDILMELKFVADIYDFKIGVKPYGSIPTGRPEDGFGKGKFTYGISFLFTKEWETIHFHSQFGYTYNNNTINEKIDLWDYSVAVEKFLFTDLSIVLETGIAQKCCPDMKDLPQFILAGIIYQLKENLMLDIGLMKGLNSSENEYALLTGLTLGI